MAEDHWAVVYLTARNQAGVVVGLGFEVVLGDLKVAHLSKLVVGMNDHLCFIPGWSKAHKTQSDSTTTRREVTAMAEKSPVQYDLVAEERAIEGQRLVLASLAARVAAILIALRREEKTKRKRKRKPMSNTDRRSSA